MEQHFDKLMVVLWILFGEYILVFFAIMADLWAGVRKARQRHEVRTSYGFSRTVTKAARYYNTMIALTVIDAMQIIGVWYLSTYYDYRIPIFPVVTLIGAVGIGLIEIRSIYEKAEDKVKNDYAQLAILFGKLMQNKDKPEEIAEVVTAFLKKENKDNGTDK